ncbi:MAG: hypothetical protein SGCHY_005422 [Lobulomycetales sp.]
MSRPEHQAPPDIFYNQQEARKYSLNSRVAAIQTQMTLRALQLLNLPGDKALLLDIGCGSGLSGQVIEEHGHLWCGMDVSKDMLDVASEQGSSGDLVLSDIGQGVPFRPGTFDGAISISVIQWLCNADKSSHVPRKRLTAFFSTLYSSLTRGARAVFQFYPESPAQIEMIVASATRAGFSGGLVIDYPNSTKAKKYFLCLFAGSNSIQEAKQQKIPEGLGTDHDQEAASSVLYSSERQRRSVGGLGARGKKGSISDKQWILKKKELYRKRGVKTASDSKFTARKRKPRF